MSTIAQPDQEIIVRGSEEHKEYLKYRHGAIKDKVNGIEAFFAVTGRLVLVFYTVYVSVAAYLYPRLPNPLPTWFVLLDIFMTALQVFGLEGSLAGLIHLRDDMAQRGKQSEAKVIDAAVNSARLLLVASAIEIALELVGKVGPYDLANALKFYTAGLYIVRIFVISGYLIAMARLEHNGPRIISSYEAKKLHEEKEQKQIRIDNAAIMTVVSDEIKKWVASQPGLSVVEELSGKVERMETEMESKMESVLFPFLGKMESEMESVLAEMERGIEAKWKGEMESIRAFLESKMETRRITVQELPESPLPPVRKPLQLPTRQQPASQPIGDMGAFIHDCMRQGITTTSAIQSHAVKQGMKAPGTGTISRYRSTFQAGNMESKMERA